MVKIKKMDINTQTEEEINTRSKEIAIHIKIADSSSVIKSKLSKSGVMIMVYDSQEKFQDCVYITPIENFTSRRFKKKSEKFMSAKQIQTKENKVHYS